MNDRILPAVMGACLGCLATVAAMVLLTVYG